MKKWFSWMLKLSITFGMLWYIFTTTPFSEVIDSIALAKVSYIIVAMLIMAFTIYLEAYRMKILTDKQGMWLSMNQIIDINLITNFYGLFLPGSIAGGAIRWHKLSQPNNKWMEAFASISFNRLIGTIVLVEVGILFWALDANSRSNYMIGFILFAILGVLLITYVMVFDEKISCFLRENSRKFNLSLVPGVIRSKISKLLISTGQYHGLSRSLLIYIFGLSLVSHLLGILTFYLFALSLGINISFINIGWVRSFILIITMLPVSFAGLGVREGTLIFLLQPYGVSTTDAVALSFLLFARTLLLGGIGGIFEAKNLFLPNRCHPEIKEVDRGLERG
ncbi:MAG TPA: lysylphosphatidylglycerol synthase transmembrane domain-containing protein [Candidatus Brocadiaceae bacterium]